MRKFKGIFTLVIAFAMALMLNTNVALAAPLDGTAQHDAAYYRSQLSQMFNAKEYAARYPEVAKKVGNSNKALFNHYLTTGIYTCNENENFVPDWSARWFTRLVLMTVGDCTGQDVYVLLASYAANPDNYGKVQALDIIFNSMVLTGMPPYEMMLASATQVVEVEPGVTLVIIDNPPSGGDGGGPSVIIWRISNTADRTEFESTYSFCVPDGYELIIDENYKAQYWDEGSEDYENTTIYVQNGGVMKVNNGVKLTIGENGGGIENCGTIENNGTIDVEHNGRLYTGNNSRTDSGTTINNGTMNITGDFGGISVNAGQLINNGTIDATFEDAVLSNLAQFENNGTIYVSNDTIINCNPDISGNPVIVQ